MWNIVQEWLKQIGYAIVPILLAAQTILFPVPANANSYLQCVPYAREQSGIQIYGDAHTWWKQSENRYHRGNLPIEGAVLSLKSHGKMRLGHVAYVSKVLDSRNILLNHSNWSPINGRRGQIERNVAAVDVSRDNDWSQVKIWYAPINGLGKTAYPVNGFIYPDRIHDRNKASRQWVSAKPFQKGREPDRTLFNQDLRDDLQREARSEEFLAYNTSQPTDLIGELLDTLGD